MTLREIAEAVAVGLDLTVSQSEDAHRVVMVGRGVELELAAFFGGWQIVLKVPDGRRFQFFEEDVRMLVERVGRRIVALEREHGQD